MPARKIAALDPPKVTLDGEADPADSQQLWPDQAASTDEFVRWCYDRLRTFCLNDEEFTRTRRLIERETTFAELAREEMTRHDPSRAVEVVSSEEWKRAQAMLEARIRRRFKEVCDRLGRVIAEQLGSAGHDPAQ